MSDPLLCLRQAIKSKDKVSYTKDGQQTEILSSATHIDIPPNHSFLKTTPTRYRKPDTNSSNPTATPQDFYSLQAVHIAWLFRDATVADYMRHARERGLGAGFVSITERKAVVDWLEGREGHPERVAPLAGDTTTPPGSPVRGSQSISTPYKSAAPDATSSPSKRKYVPDLHDVEVVKKLKQSEVELQDRNTVLRGSKPNNFSSIRAVYAEKLKKVKEAGKPGSSTPAAASQPTPDPKLVARKARNMYPIIMISSSPTALITMHNVKKFLQESVFETPQDARARAAAEGNPRPEDMIPIYRKRTHIDPSGKETESHARYFAVDSAEALAKFDFRRYRRQKTNVPKINNVRATPMAKATAMGPIGYLPRRVQVVHWSGRDDQEVDPNEGVASAVSYKVSIPE
ncbi:hypothetical protein ONZ45_g9523 [Pleurotus djamor]|nr:hypothetical protein ONZ45_g9523 [Pleurotus djamor]